MAKGINKAIEREPSALYLSGYSLPEVAAKTGIPISTLRSRFNQLGILRSRAEGIRIAARKGRVGHHARGTNRTFSDAHKASIRAARQRWGEAHAAGISTKPNGYIEYTRGPHKGRSMHVVVMEDRIGRRLAADEVVHHIDGNRANNDIHNLALCTRSGHTRLHRHEDKLRGLKRKRNNDGQWC